MVRKAQSSDLTAMIDIYNKAQEYMKHTGNPQWQLFSFTPEDVMADIESGHYYVVERNGRVCGSMGFPIGEDPAYAYGLDEGEWRYDGEYATVHKLASDGTEHGVFAELLEFGKKICPHIRLDTHRDNDTMHYLVGQLGFHYCGTFIGKKSGMPWVAYEEIFK